MAVETRVMSCRLPLGQAALVEQIAARHSVSPAEYMRRAVVRQLRNAALADAAEVAASGRDA